LKKIKLIWDFKGPAAGKTAEHHEKHLKDYVSIEKTNLDITGFQHLHDMHSLAFMVVEENEVIVVRDALKPHRGELYTDRP